MKKILFPTDFSEVATNAFVHALALAKSINAELVLLHTFEFPIVDNQYFPENYAVIYNSLESTNKEHFKNEIEKLKGIAKHKNSEDVKISHLLLDGDLMYNLKEIINKQPVEFVVMGTSGAHGWEEVFIGTNTGDAINNLKVPVLSIPANCKYHKTETIGFTTRYREKDKEQLQKVIEIAKSTKASVKCLYVKTHKSDNSEDVFNQWKEEFSKEPITFFIVENNNVNDSVLEFIKTQNIDLLTMVSYKRTFFEWLFTSSTAEKISNHSTVPVLVLHE